MNLKRLRMSRNLTQEALAEKLQVKRTTVTMWEKGHSAPSVQTLKKIAQLLDCTVDELVKED